MTGLDPSKADPVDSPGGMTRAELRELLVTSERRRQVAEGSLRQAEAVLAGLEIVATAEDERQLFSGILDAVGELVPFDDAAVIIDAGEAIGVVASTDGTIPLQLIEVGPYMRRVFSGHPSIVMSLAMVPDWKPLMAAEVGYQSAMLIPLRSKDLDAAFVCLARSPAAYTSRHLEILQYLAPLAGQALQRYHDMNELGSLIDRLDHMAHRDSLTGLANRTVFANRLAKSVAAYRQDGSPVAVLHLDLDDFKLVNDTLGHQAGDELIQTVAERIEGATRSNDVVARMGGDEFAVLLVDMDRVGLAEAVAERVLDEVNQPVHLAGQAIRPNASIGISVCPRDEPEPDHLLGSADIALYDAKAAGGGRAVTFDPDMRATRDQHHRIEAGLVRAMERDELVVHYQPIFSIDQPGTVTAVEALIRWNHPEHGLLPPPAFLPVAERSNLIVDVGSWVLRRSLGDLAGWLRADHSRRVAVNAAAKQLLTPGWVSAIRMLLREHRLPPSSLELELSEEIVAQRTLDTMTDTLGTMAEFGLGLAFDDFGTGYSSVLQLRRFPGHRLKIDRHFIASVCTNGADRAVVKGMIDLAHGLSLDVVGEGVETAEQLDVLAEFGCDEAQGFLLGHPAPITELETTGLLCG